MIMEIHVNGFYIVAEKGGGGVINANRTKADRWETFKLVRSPYQEIPVAGTWKDKYGVVYNYGQKANKFWWRAPSAKLYGEGTVNNDHITTSLYEEVTNQLKANVNGIIKVVDLNGMARRIEWSDGLVIRR